MEKNGAGAARVAVGDTECNGSTLRTATPRPLAPLNGHPASGPMQADCAQSLILYIYALCIILYGKRERGCSQEAYCGLVHGGDQRPFVNAILHYVVYVRALNSLTQA